MTIHYECDNCGRLVHTVEALGTGVYDDDVKGRVYMNQDPVTGLTVVVNLVNEQVQNQNQFCYACMWRCLKSLIDVMGPSDGLPDSETTDPELPEVSVEADVSEASSDAGPWPEIWNKQ